MTQDFVVALPRADRTQRIQRGRRADLISRRSADADLISSRSADVVPAGWCGLADVTVGGVGVLVRARRAQLRMTQRQLAVRAGISVGAVRDIEQGRTVEPRPDSVAGIAAALGLSASEREAFLSLAREHSGSDRPPQGRGRTRSEWGLRLAALGPLAVWRDGAPVELGPARQRAVLALLALYRTGLSRAALIDALWAEDPPQSAVPILSGYVTRIRQLLSRPLNGAGTATVNGQVVSWDGWRYQLAPDLVRTDVAEFGELTSQARREAAAGNPAAACGSYQQALGLWRDDPLADLGVLADHPAVNWLNRERVAVVIEYADAAGAAGSPGHALDQLRLLAERQPLDERVHARLMTALAATGQQAAALSVFEDMRLRLDRELGIRPDREMIVAHARVVRQEARLARAGGAGR